MILGARAEIASWAEEHVVRDQGQASFRETTAQLITFLFSGQWVTNSGRNYCKRKLTTCFVCCCLQKVLNTVPHAVLWQVLEELGVTERILDIIKSLYAHDSAAVRSLQGISETFT